MLVLSRKLGERIWIGPDIFVEVGQIGRNGIRLAFNAPRDTVISREELLADDDPRKRKTRGGVPSRESGREF